MRAGLKGLAIVTAAFLLVLWLTDSAGLAMLAMIVTQVALPPSIDPGIRLRAWLERKGRR